MVKKQKQKKSHMLKKCLPYPRPTEHPVEACCVEVLFYVSFSAVEFQPYSLFSCSSPPQARTSTVGSDARIGHWKPFASDQQLLGRLA